MSEPGSQRLFFALWPDAAVREALAALGAGLAGRQGRPTHPDDLHLTLLFLGQVDQARYPSVLAGAEAMVGSGFDLEIDRLGYWKRPRLIWCGPSRVPSVLLRLVSDLQGQMSMCGFPPERRAYAPHVTLSRKAPPMTDRRLADPLRWPVREFVLVTSASTARGSRYQVLKKWPLDS